MFSTAHDVLNHRRPLPETPYLGTLSPRRTSRPTAKASLRLCLCNLIKMCLLDGEERYASALFTRLQMPFSSPFMDPSHPPNARGCAVQAGGGYGLIQKGTCQSPHCLTRASVTFPSRGPCGLEGDSAGCKEQTSRHHLLSRRKETASAVTGSLMGGFELTGDETNGKSEQQLSPGQSSRTPRETSTFED